MLASIQEIYPAETSHTDFSRKKARQQLIGLLMSEGLRGMLEGEDHRSLDMASPWSLHFETGALGFFERPTADDFAYIAIRPVAQVCMGEDRLS